MRKNNEFTTRVIKKPWTGGANRYSFYVTIPSEMVKKLRMTQDTLLSIEVIDDSIITIKKLDNKAGLTKREKEKIQNHFNNNKQEVGDIEESNMIGKTLPVDFKNPLDELDDI